MSMGIYSSHNNKQWCHHLSSRFQYKFSSSPLFHCGFVVHAVLLVSSLPYLAPAPDVGCGQSSFPYQQGRASLEDKECFQEYSLFPVSELILKVSWLLRPSLCRLGGLEKAVQKSTAAQSVATTVGGFCYNNSCLLREGIFAPQPRPTMKCCICIHLHTVELNCRAGVCLFLLHNVR